MAAKNLIERSPDPDDRRRNIITLTQAGSRHLKELDGVVAEIQDTLLAPLTPAERATLTDLLARLVDHHTRP
jgi:DNA-binding MarR family transcriptional regulator